MSKRLPEHPFGFKNSLADMTNFKPPLRRPRRSDSSPVVSSSSPCRKVVPVLSGAQKLPVELVYEIFTLLFVARDTCATFSHEVTVPALRRFLSATFPYNVLSICHNWRVVIFSQPVWWTTLSIGFHGLGNVCDTGMLGSPYELVGRWLEMSLAKVDAFGGQNINGVVKFLGDYNPQLLAVALLPLLQRSYLWGDLEIILDEPHASVTTLESTASLKLPLMCFDLTHLKNARSLTLNGRIWHFSVNGALLGRFYIGGPDLRPNLPSLRALTTLRLTNIAPAACVGLIGAAARSLEELSLTTDQHTLDWTPHTRILASRLRKFELVFVGTLPHEGHEDYEEAHPLLESFRCMNLEELSVKYENDTMPPLNHIEDFVRVSGCGGFGRSLRSFKLECPAARRIHAYGWSSVGSILVRMPRLRSLALLCRALPREVLLFLSSCHKFDDSSAYGSSENYEGALCPDLEEIHVRDVRMSQGNYAQLLTERASFGAQPFLKATFENCVVERYEAGVENDFHLSCFEAFGTAAEDVKFLVDSNGLELTFLISSTQSEMPHSDVFSL